MFLQSPCASSCPSSHSSMTSGTGTDGSGGTQRRPSSMYSYGSSITDDSSTADVGLDSRRSSTMTNNNCASIGTTTAKVKSNGSLLISRAGELRQQQQQQLNGNAKKRKLSKGKLRKIATQVTRAIRRKRRESLVIRRESKATRVVAAIITAFLLCWLPYFILHVYRGFW